MTRVSEDAAPWAPLDETAEFLENRPFASIQCGDSAGLVREITAHDIQLFAAVSGNVNPSHVDVAFAVDSPSHEVVAPAMLAASLISTVLGTKLPGPGTADLGQTLEFLEPVVVGDALTVTVTVMSKDEHKQTVHLFTRCVNQRGELVIQGQAEVLAPSAKIRVRRVALPEPGITVDRNHRYGELLDAARNFSRVRMGVVHPCSAESLEGAIEAARLNLIEAILIGPAKRIRSLAERCRISLSGITLVDVPHSHAAARKAVEMARLGEVDALMKGSLSAEELMGEVTDEKNGLHTARRISHVSVVDVPCYARPLLITDTGFNVSPDLQTKVDIVRNAVDLAHALKIAAPKVAILSGAEALTSTLPSAMDAAALSKMAEHGQIAGASIDGPLALEKAVAKCAPPEGSNTSAVTGDSDVLVVPDLESGRMLLASLRHLGDAQTVGIVLGARVPIALSGNTDSAHSRIAGCALALLFLRHQSHRAAEK